MLRIAVKYRTLLYAARVIVVRCVPSILHALVKSGKGGAAENLVKVLPRMCCSAYRSSIGVSLPTVKYATA